MVNKNTYEILKIMDKLHKMGSYNEVVTIDEINSLLKIKVDWDYLICLGNIDLITHSSKSVGNKQVNAYKILPGGYTFLENKKESRNSRIIGSLTLLITLITLLLTLL